MIILGGDVIVFGVQTRAARAAVILAALGLVGLAGCGTTPQNPQERAASRSAAPSTTPSASAPAPERRPVAASGGACKLLSYQLVADATGADFDVAAAGKHDKSSTCVLQVYGHEYPDLALTITPTKADAKAFKESVAPDGAAEVGKLGKAAYRVVGNPEDKAGPSAEVGWLADGKILTLRYTYESGVSAQQAAQMSGSLVTLAKKIKTG